MEMRFFISDLQPHKKNEVRYEYFMIYVKDRCVRDVSATFFCHKKYFSRFVELPLSNGDGANVTLQITADHVTPERKDNSQWHKLCFLHRVNHFIRRSVHTQWMVVRKLLQVALLLMYVAYFSYAMYYKSSGEPALRLLVFTVIGAVVLVRRLLARLGLCGRPACVGQLLDRCRERGIHIRKIIKW